MVQQEKRKTYIIAEAGVNHNGSLKIAKKMVDTASQAGADAIKFQMFKAEKLVTKKAPLAAYQKDALQATRRSQFEMLNRLELSCEEFLQLQEYCQEKIEFLVTPFDEESLQFLVEKCKLTQLKISSGDLTNLPFLLQAAKTGLPVILSTGMGTVGEIEQALMILAYGYSLGEAKETVFSWDAVKDVYFSEAGQRTLQQKVSLLHCTTEYPAPVSEVNLLALATMRETFGLSVGYSDHTEGNTIAIGAVALGSCIVEKHFTLDKTWEGPDHKASLEPGELEHLIRSIRQIELALGHGRKLPGACEQKNRIAARKSLVAAKSIQAGECFSIENLTVKRPGHGVSPAAYWAYLGQLAQKNYDEDDLI